MKKRKFGLLSIITISGVACLLLLTQTSILSIAPNFAQGVGEKQVENVLDLMKDGEEVVLMKRSAPSHLNYVIDRIYDDPSLFWLDMKYNAFSIGKISAISIKEKYDDIKKKERELKEKSKEVLARISPSMSEFEKVLVIHDWICENTIYKESKNSSDQDIYGTMILKEARCAGYAKTFTYLLNQAGIKSRVISGKAYDKNKNLIPHAWNIVYIDNEPYYFDITWNDDDTKGHSHEWFGVTKEEMEGTHFPNKGYKWEEAKEIDNSYYVQKEMYIENATPQELSKQIKKQGLSLEIKCKDKEVLQGMIEILRDKESMLEVMRDRGIRKIDNIRYLVNSHTNTIQIIFS